MKSVIDRLKNRKSILVVILFLILLVGVSISFIPKFLNVKSNNSNKNERLDNYKIAYTYNGESIDKTYEWLIANKVVNTVTCQNGTIATWNYDTNSVDLSDLIIPDYCTVDFKDGYTVTLTATNGTITSASSASIGYNGTLNFDVTPNDGYKLEGSTISCTGSAVGSMTTNGVKISSITETQTCTVTLKQILPTLYEKILADNPTVSTRTDFSVTNVANTTGTIYSTDSTEDGSTVYYYSGNTTNNWVLFGGFYWRIIRTNEDGSVRLLYSGTSHDTTSGYIGSSVFNSSFSNPMYVGYMYGTSGSLAKNRTNTNSSIVKQNIDTWYQNNLLTDYNQYISKTAIYCNDRSVGSGTYSTSTSSTFYFGAYTRLYTYRIPTYKCGGNTSGGLFSTGGAVEDKFSVSTTGGGNGQLQYPIALMTADEVAFAGGKVNANLSSPYAWYYTNSVGEGIIGSTYWWTMSPGYWEGYADIWVILDSSAPGHLYDFRLDLSKAIRPAISLKSCVLAEGDGTSTSPYQISIDDECATAEN